MNETLFYVLGLGLVAIALVVSFVGLRCEKFPASRALLVGGTVAVAALVVGDRDLRLAQRRGRAGAPRGTSSPRRRRRTPTRATTPRPPRRSAAESPRRRRPRAPPRRRPASVDGGAGVRRQPAAPAATRSPTPARPGPPARTSTARSRASRRGLHPRPRSSTRTPRSPQGYPPDVMPTDYGDRAQPRGARRAGRLPRRGDRGRRLGAPARAPARAALRLAKIRAVSGKRYHVTTFGCQMNEHDSERMKGMLESLGYERGGRARRGRPDPLQHLLDPRGGRQPLHRPPRARRSGSSPRTPSGSSASAAAGPSRSRTRSSSASRSSTSPSARGRSRRLAEFLTSDSITAQGYFEFEDFAGHLPMKREREFQAWLQISQGCNCRCSYCIVPSTRGREQSRDPVELVAEVERARRRRRARGRPCWARTSTPTGATCRGERKTSFAELLRDASTRSTGSSGSATRARTRRTCART